jgi:hypothetical protein
MATMAGPRRSPGESVEALEEAIQIIRAGFSGEESVSFDGRFYSVAGWEPGPPPAHPIGIWLGAYKPRMLRLTGRFADGWIPSLGRMSPDDMAAARKLIDEAAEKAGRDPAEILTLTNVGGDMFDGPPEQSVETLLALSESLGLHALILPAESVEQVERLVAEVVPGLRKEQQ